MSEKLGNLVESARRQLSSLTGLSLGTTLGVRKDEKGWHVEVELLEKKSLPDGLDILATYEALTDDDGVVLEFNRKVLRKRIDTELPLSEEE